MIDLSANAKKIFNDLYCIEGESIEDCFKRAAKEYATCPEEEEFAYQIQEANIFRGNTPVYFNSGSKSKVYSACFIVDIQDSMESIYDIANVARRIFQVGAGIGIPIGNLREKNAPIFEGGGTPIGASSGPIVFMKLYDAVGATTKSGGRARRAAILCSMPVDHPDIMEFISCKEVDGTFSNINISVSVTDQFMQSLKDNVSTYPLISPAGNQRVGTGNPKEVWEAIAKMAWKSGDPGLLFIDTINNFNPVASISKVKTPNPCGETVLPSWNSCNLGMINVSKFVSTDKTFNFSSLHYYSSKIMVLMDNLLDKMDFPDKRFKQETLKYRPVGFGLAGLSDTFYMMDIKYGSKESCELAGKIMQTMTDACVAASVELAKNNGSFHSYDLVKEDVKRIIKSHVSQKTYDEVLPYLDSTGLRNTQFTICQPTGTTAISCDCSYGIEPCFGLVFEKNLISGEKMYFVNSVFENRFKSESWYTEELLQKIIENGGSLKNLRRVPKEVKDVFVVAHDIKPRDRVDLQAAIQAHCSNAISSTVNLPNSATPNDVADIYMYAYESGLKGITVYRDGCKKDQPITFSPQKETIEISKRPPTIKGNTTEIDFGEKTVLITHSSYSGELKEIIFNLGKSGNHEYALCEALGRAVSIGLRAGIDKKEYVKQFRDIKADQPVWVRLEEGDKKPVQIWSIPDGLAKLIERYYINGGGDGQQNQMLETCPKCHENSLMMVEGCATCQSCGWSKCS